MLNWRFAVAVALIAAAFLLAVGGHISVNHTLAQLKQDLTDALTNNASTESVARLISFWEQQKTKLSYFVEHEYLATLNDAFFKRHERCKIEFLSRLTRGASEENQSYKKR